MATSKKKPAVKKKPVTASKSKVASRAAQTKEDPFIRALVIVFTALSIAFFFMAVFGYS